HAELEDTGVLISIYPSAGDIRFHIGGGEVQFDAKTSIAGPGYHVAVVDMCDHLREELGIDWKWPAGADDTDYVINRSRAALTEKFVVQFQAFCEFVESKPEAAQAFNLEIGLAARRPKGAAASPMGIFSAQFFLDALETIEQLEQGAAEFFPWWN